jgi:hypothetical protein
MQYWPIALSITYMDQQDNQREYTSEESGKLCVLQLVRPLKLFEKVNSLANELKKIHD